MRSVILYIAASIDGYIARSNGDINWLHEFGAVENEDFGYKKFYESVDTTLMGNKTYREIINFDIPFPYSDKQNYVFSRSKRGFDEHVHFVNHDIDQFVHDLKSKEGKDIWLIGGGQINSLLLDFGLINKIILTTIPIILGDGIPLFTNSTNTKKLRLVDSNHYPNGFVQSTFSLAD